MIERTQLLSERPTPVPSVERRTRLGAVRSAHSAHEGPRVDRLNRESNDSVSELLRAVRVHSTVYCLSDFRAPWGFGVEDSTVAKFHVVLEGSCVLTAEGEEGPVTVGCGDVVLLPSGRGHTVRDRQGSRVRHLERILVDHPVDADARLVYGGRGRRTRLVCGGFVLSDPLPTGLLDMLPAVIHLDAATVGLSRWLEPLLGLLRAETDQAQPGAAALFTKVADVFLAQALRSYLVSARDGSSLPLDHLRDPAIARAVELLRSRPQQQWSVAGLAGDVCMSRTLFAARFRELVGEPPIRHLTRIRMSRAAGYLTTTGQSLYEIAHRTGYDGEASLSKAFRRAFGVSPGEYRRRSLTSPIRLDAEAS
jgi:AraC-like DNA-binding protein/mannose-6-phosphate isomerase-like protein (cupin superfamily)